MLTTPHALIGLAIIKVYPHPGGVLLAFLSHYLVDFTIPHWNPHIFGEMKNKKQISSQSLKIILADGLLAVGLTLLAMKFAWPNMYLTSLYGLGSFASVLPDAIEIPYYFFNFKHRFLLKYADFCHKNQADGNLFWGLLTQLIFVIASLKQVFF